MASKDGESLWLVAIGAVFGLALIGGVGWFLNPATDRGRAEARRTLLLTWPPRIVFVTALLRLIVALLGRG
jgi:ABC-type antimicrobial peptide transport system permease subunit